jgi:hypothetical protein
VDDYPYNSRIAYHDQEASEVRMVIDMSPYIAIGVILLLLIGAFALIFLSGLSTLRGLEKLEHAHIRLRRDLDIVADDMAVMQVQLQDLAKLLKFISSKLDRPDAN